MSGLSEGRMQVDFPGVRMGTVTGLSVGPRLACRMLMGQL